MNDTEEAVTSPTSTAKVRVSTSGSSGPGSGPGLGSSVLALVQAANDNAAVATSIINQLNFFIVLVCYKVV